MGLIEFSDNKGGQWRVWHVETPPARAHLMDPLYRTGWLVFERVDGSERRRLNQVPEDWASLPRERLSLLCSLAVPVVMAKGPSTGQQPTWPRPADEATSEG
jgi:hypothetical protein